MDGIKINVDPQQVNQFIADAILESAIGEQIKKSIQERLTDYRFKQSIEKVIDSMISQIVFQLLNSEHGDELRAAVKEKISGDIVSDLAGKALDNWLAIRE